jgi:hypothetical protein
MNIFERARDIILKPKETWPVIKGESIEIKQLFLNYAAPLALIPALCSLIGMTLIGIRMPSGNVVRSPFFASLSGGVVGYVLNLASIFLVAWIVKLLAPYFNSKADLNSSVKVVIYSMTPVWLVGIFALLPGLGILSILGLYGIYLLVLGLQEILDTPSNRVALYTIAVLAVGFLISLILSGIVVGLFYGPMYMHMMAV